MVANLYGFDSSDYENQAVMNMLRTQSDYDEIETFDSVGQFRIVDVTLKPKKYDPFKLSSWQLDIASAFEGVNTKTGQTLLFPSSTTHVYDSYTLSAKQFSKMVENGLYDDFDAYVALLNNKLRDKSYYRPVTASLERLLVRDNFDSIRGGVYDAFSVKYMNYYIGTNHSVSWDLSLEDNTNFVKILHDNLDLQLSTEEVSQSHTVLENKVQTDIQKKLLEQTTSSELKPVELHDELDLSDDSLETNSSELFNSTNPESSLAPVKVDSELELNSDTDFNLADLNKSLSELGDLAKKVDDPSDTYQDIYYDDVSELDNESFEEKRKIKSNNNLQKVRRKLKENQKQRAQHVQQAQNILKTQDKDDGFELG